jgi:hypothetical protein
METPLSKLYGSLHANASFTIVVEIASNLSTLGGSLFIVLNE